MIQLKEEADKIVIQTLLIVISVIVSWKLALVNPALNSMELGAMLNYYAPIFIGIFTGILYIIGSNFFHRSNWVITLICISFNLMLGILLFLIIWAI